MSISPERPSRLPGTPGGLAFPLPRPLPQVPRPTVPAVPPPPATDPFAALPYPSPGDRIRAEDFTRLSQSLRIVADCAQIAAQLFGRTFGEARTVLAGQGYGITRVMSVLGNEPAGPDDTSFDTRRVISVLPVALGGRDVVAVVSETVDTRRFAPDLSSAAVSYTYRQAVETMRSVLGEAGLAGLPMATPELRGRSLAEAARQLR
ncbi:hypothetical protein ACTI_85450 [Actinoplanes sp. OR16]|uniref:hypothetical protein n=1 Tax=Actinoplanes sp. OR16 TaxID=946334 RepID=UPI000F6E53A8|nr:hypothetical protein [Actinoplanes sp. OR16]BBH71860.1 hypothetical protein ACTI_85450 [Actinoplanes sp. OR16]